MTYETIHFETAEAIATITLDRPDNANALNPAMGRELYDAALRCAADGGIRAVIVTGKGKMFCAGGDLKAFHEQGDQASAMVTRLASDLHAALTRLAHLDAPVVMAVNGMAAGAGFSLALSGDFIIASEAARFVSAYTGAGLTPDGSSTYFLPKHVGLLRAKELLFTNRVLSAEEACAWGLANKVVPPDALMAEARSLAAGFAQGPTRVFGALKQLLLSAYDSPLESQLERETRNIAMTVGSRDGRHGIESFLAKKPPSFQGE